LSKAYVLINVERDLDITSRLKKIPEIKEVYGIYDMIVKVETKDKKDLQRVVIERIRRINGVRSTMTLVVVS